MIVRISRMKLPVSISLESPPYSKPELMPKVVSGRSRDFKHRSLHFDSITLPAHPRQWIGDRCIDGEFAVGLEFVAVLNAGEEVGLAGQGVAPEQNVDEGCAEAVHIGE
jgi:hypothetical protein